MGSLNELWTKVSSHIIDAWKLTPILLLLEIWALVRGLTIIVLVTVSISIAVWTDSLSPIVLSWLIAIKKIYLYKDISR